MRQSIFIIREAISSFIFFKSLSFRWHFRQGLLKGVKWLVGGNLWKLHNLAFTIWTKRHIFITLKWIPPLIELFTGPQLLRTLYILNISINFVYIRFPIVRKRITIEVFLLLLDQFLLLCGHCKLTICLPLQAIYILHIIYN